MSIVPYQPPAWLELVGPVSELANAVRETEFVPRSLRGNTPAITAAILYGAEVGLGPMQSLARISVIDGRPALAAEAQRALVLQAGHELWVEESSTARVVLAGRRRGAEQTTRVAWTMDDAKRAGLVGKPNWRAYPRQMLLARASAELCRAIFADVVGGLGAVEEFEGQDVERDGAAGISDPPPSPASGRRRRRSPPVPAAPPVTSGDPPPPPEAADPPLPGEDDAADQAGRDEAGDAPAPEPGLPLDAPPVQVDPEAAEAQADAAWHTSRPAEPQPDPDDPGQANVATQAMKNGLFAAYRAAGISPDRGARLTHATLVLGREVDSFNHLTPGEVSTLCEELGRRAPQLDQDPGPEAG